MLVVGKIIKLECNETTKYGFIKIEDIEDKVLFNTLSFFHNICFEDLKVGDKVSIYVKQTDQGPFAESLTLFRHPSQKDIPVPPESSL